jgi:hypothetical protein
MGQEVQSNLIAYDHGRPLRPLDDDVFVGSEVGPL